MSVVCRVSLYKQGKCNKAEVFKFLVKKAIFRLFLLKFKICNAGYQIQTAFTVRPWFSISLDFHDEHGTYRVGSLFLRSMVSVSLNCH